ncbi:hypothetical protein [Tunturiibacter lichenicola]|uniref:hypothetical protein n=1 Tax=Tunturiibacter lichenicola TaxID=2051959 RepID=UPI003D9AEAEA
MIEPLQGHTEGHRKVVTRPTSSAGRDGSGDSLDLDQRAASALSAVLLIAVFATVGCGSGESSPMPSGNAPTITTQPASAAIPLDSSATLSSVDDGNRTAALSVELKRQRDFGDECCRA